MTTPEVIGYGMTREQREAEVARIYEENRAVLSTPLMSEGAMSATQLNRMGKRAFEQYQRNGQLKMILQARVRDLRRSDEEIESEYQRVTTEAKASARRQIENRIKWWRDVGRNKAGKLRPKMAKAIAEAESELAKLN